MPTVGFLDNTTATSRAAQVLAFRQALSEAGFVEGRNLAIEFRWAEGKIDRLPELADDLVRRRVAAIATNAQYSLAAAKAATSTIPIVFVTGADPVERGYAPSLNRPAGNVTGVSSNSTPLNPKRFELLGELVAKPAVLAVLLDPAAVPTTPTSLEMPARTLERQIVVARAASESEFEAAFTGSFKRGPAGCLSTSLPTCLLTVGNLRFWQLATGCPRVLGRASLSTWAAS
jgi:putative ABC transport system substrate-binding protein